MIELKSKPLKIRYSKSGMKYKDKFYASEHVQTTIPVEVRRLWGITAENIEDKRIVFIILGDGRVEVQCILAETTNG